MAAICSFPTDALLHELLQDDRVVLRLEELRQTLEDELVWVSNIELSVWELVGHAVGVPARELRSDTVAAAQTSVAFVHDRFFGLAQELPWSLAVGNVVENLRELGELDAPPEETTSAKIWSLLKVNFNISQLVAGVELFKLAPWSSTCVEQQHGSCARLHQYHKTYGQQT
eukprot:11169264-Lingulodinium_polyedra.AAC.1